MPKLTVTRGLPASGKTTWAKQQVDKSQGKIKRVNKDDLRAMVHNGAWSREREKSIIAARNVLIALYLNQGFDVICDDTNLAPKHLGELTKIAEGVGADFEVHDIYCPPSICEERDAKRVNGVGPKVIRQMWRDFICQKAPEYDPSLPDVIICDIDGTIAHGTGRSMYDYSRVSEDRVDETIKNLIFSTGYKYIFVSGRESDCRKQTEDWLNARYLNYVDLFMRKAGDKRADYIVKREIYENEIKGKYNIMFVLDDRDQVVDMWRELGYKVLQVGDGRF